MSKFNPSVHGVLNLYRVLYLNLHDCNLDDSQRLIEPIQSVVFKYDSGMVRGLVVFQIEPIQSVVFK